MEPFRTAGPVRDLSRVPFLPRFVLNSFPSLSPTSLPAINFFSIFPVISSTPPFWVTSRGLVFFFFGCDFTAPLAFQVIFFCRSPGWFSPFFSSAGAGESWLTPLLFPFSVQTGPPGRRRLVHMRSGGLRIQYFPTRFRSEPPFSF